MEISNELEAAYLEGWKDAKSSDRGETPEQEWLLSETYCAALHAEPCEPVAWMFEGKGWGREVMLSEQEALERKARLSRTWDITITPLYETKP